MIPQAALITAEQAREIERRLLPEANAKLHDIAKRSALFNVEVTSAIQAEVERLAQSPGDAEQIGGALGMYFLHLSALEGQRIESEHKDDWPDTLTPAND
jgi:hypothetical protein